MGKNIIVCCDGTANRYTHDDENTNVVKFFCLLERDYPDKQVAYYDPGVGVVSVSASNIVYDYIDRATGYGIEENIKQAYRFLMDTYEKGDQIFLFGFSRGAYTVRSLSGLLERCGLLEKRNYNLIDDAYYYYIKEGKDVEKIAENFKKHLSRPVEITCVGVWDTVKAFFAKPLRGKLFHDTRLPVNVRYGYHALSIDERRRQFKPTLWEEKPVGKQEILQVWFPGVHADIGGSYKDDDLSDISLEWMIAHVSKHGVHFKEELYEERPFELKINEDPKFHGDIHDEYKRGIWFMLGRYKRELPASAKVHESAVMRMRYKVLNYNPSNLIEPLNVVVTPEIKDTRIKKKEGRDFLLKNEYGH